MFSLVMTDTTVQVNGVLSLRNDCVSRRSSDLDVGKTFPNVKPIIFTTDKYHLLWFMWAD